MSDDYSSQQSSQQFDYTATQTEVQPPSYDFDDDDDDARSHHTAGAMTPQSTDDLG
eukprot:CAMPEP_0201591286 /NCGR_PEP_ID=MMETSP0190_2-20130828/187708_1 /ASSEMBLY_ACC=CAM_ASM_000263 /TAXON_ID=37353 /ORGANISM="Rosalina sp." /LENGTH=55 /DNA_ID=CAMNT_0048049299 /DNA_START=17 /DNA_END=180 /DNA_ORIENTATION=-